MKKTLFTLFTLTFCTVFSFAQDLIERTQSNAALVPNYSAPNKLAQLIEEKKAEAVFQSCQLLNLDVASVHRKTFEKAVSDAALLTLDQRQLRELFTARPSNILFYIPVAPKRFIEVELTQVKIKSDNFIIKNEQEKIIEGQENLFYRGIIKGNTNSMAVLSVFEQEIRLLLADSEGTYIVGKIGNTQEDYIIYNERKLNVNLEDDWSCETEDLPKRETPNVSPTQKNADAGDCVKIYVEADYEIYQDQGGSVANVENYVDAIFNEVIAEFALAGINMLVSEVLVWTNEDPYLEYDNTSDILVNFRNNRTNFNGNLAHFITSRFFGGRAYLNVLCNSNFAYGMSGNLTSGNPANLPTSSSTFVRIAHELGHNLGLRHAHRCVWNGNGTQIDDCGNVNADEEGSEIEGEDCYDPNNPILPASGQGTIMSYCHLRLDVNGNQPIGRDLTNGFTQQGNQIMQAAVANASCLDATCGCAENYDLTVTNQSNVIPSGTYIAQNNIYTHGTRVGNGAGGGAVIFKAGNRIEITGTPDNPFIVDGATFEAFITDDICSNGNNTSNSFAGDFVNNATDIHEHIPQAQLKIYPNPAANQATVSFYVPLAIQNASLVIHTITGSVIEQIIIEDREYVKINLDFENYNNTMYFCKLLLDNDAVISEKLVVLKN